MGQKREKLSYAQLQCAQLIITSQMQHDHWLNPEHFSTANVEYRIWNKALEED